MALPTHVLEFKTGKLTVRVWRDAAEELSERGGRTSPRQQIIDFINLHAAWWRARISRFPHIDPTYIVKSVNYNARRNPPLLERLVGQVTYGVGARAEERPLTISSDGTGLVPLINVKEENRTENSYVIMRTLYRAGTAQMECGIPLSVKRKPHETYNSWLRDNLKKEIPDFAGGILRKVKKLKPQFPVDGSWTAKSFLWPFVMDMPAREFKTLAQAINVHRLENWEGVRDFLKSDTVMGAYIEGRPMPLVLAPLDVMRKLFISLEGSYPLEVVADMNSKSSRPAKERTDRIAPPAREP